MKRYIKANKGSEEIEVTVEASEMIDLTQDSEDTYYSVDSFDDYMYFVNHAVIE